MPRLGAPRKIWSARRRLVHEHVHPGAEQVAAVQGVHQRLLLDDAAARRVDHDGIRLHARQLTGADHAGRFLGQRGVDGQELHLTQQFVQRRGARDAQTLEFALWDVGIVGHHVHAQALGAVRHHAADPAQPDNAQRPVLELQPQEFAVPLARPRLAVRAGQAARRGHQVHHGQFRRRDVVALGGVQHQQAAQAGVLQIDVVDAHAAASDDFQARPGGVDQFAVHLGAAAGDQGVVLGQAAQRLGAVHVPLVVDLEAVVVQIAGVHLVADQHAQSGGRLIGLGGGRGAHVRRVSRAGRVGGG